MSTKSASEKPSVFKQLQENVVGGLRVCCRRVIFSLSLLRSDESEAEMVRAGRAVRDAMRPDSSDAIKERLMPIRLAPNATTGGRVRC